MTDVLVCVKRVPSSAGKVTLTEDGQGVDGRTTGFTVSAHEECAVELAVQRQDQRSIVGNAQDLGRDRHALGAELLYFLDEVMRVTQDQTDA